MKKKWLAALGIFLIFIGAFGLFTRRGVSFNQLSNRKTRIQSESAFTKVQPRPQVKVQKEFQDDSFNYDRHPCHENRND